MERRASRAFLTIAGFTAVALLVRAGPLLTDEFPLLAWATIAYAVASIVVNVTEAVGLDRRADWALAAMRPLLAVELVAGILGSLSTIAQGATPIPIDLLVLVWALRAAPAVKAAVGRSAASIGLVAAALVLATSTLWLRPAFAAGGMLDVKAADVTGQITADCGASPGPEALTVRYRWAWQRPGPIGGGSDVVAIVWDGLDADGNALYILGDTPAGDPAVVAGTASGPASAQAQFFEGGHGASWEWGVELSRQHYAPGEITVVLHRAAEHPRAGIQLTVEAVYFHAGAWRSAPALVGCTW